MARAIVAAEIAHITYAEFLPALVGTHAIPVYAGYDAIGRSAPECRVQRRGVSLGAFDGLGRDRAQDEFGAVTGEGLELRDAFFMPPAAFTADSGADGFLRHLGTDLAQAMDARIVDDLRNFLIDFGVGQDLAALNIQRGRDLGLATLNGTRVALGLSPYTEFEQITDDAATVDALRTAYADNVDAIDLWTGGLSEKLAPGTFLGETFGLIVARQFTALRDGDRLWYQNQGFDAESLAAIEATSLGDIIRRNTDTLFLQDDVFIFHERRDAASVTEHSELPQLVVGTDDGETLAGGSADDLLFGRGGADTLSGDAGGDVMSGGAGDDAYFVDDIGDETIENANEGIDTVFSTAHLRLTGNVENLVLQGGDDLQAGGNSLNNLLFGNSGANILTGDAGTDAMFGGAGNDVYFVDDIGDETIENANEGIDTVFSTAHLRLTGNVEFVDEAGDQPIENANEGNDTVFSTAHLRLADNVENLVLQGGDDLQAGGNSLNNLLFGNTGANILTGDAGTDAMFGGAGNDVYFVDEAGDQAIENANEGIDTVFSTAHLRLSDKVENLVLQGGDDLQAGGNSLNNLLFGNSGANILTGDAGTDAMFGGAGNDVYFVDDAGDQATENANEGIDTVFSTAHLRLSDHVENLVLQGSDNLQAAGNSLNNLLFGNTGNNILTGGAGADAMHGAAGNDVYFVDDPDDVVVENAGDGIDAVFATVSQTLTANVEALVLQGSSNLVGTGNALASNIYGNSGDNALDGGAGADVLTGNAGNDTFIFRMGEGGGHTVVDFAGSGPDAGDSLLFVGYGAGAIFTNIGGALWQLTFNGGGAQEIIAFSNGASIDASDVLFG